jgi:hypothetical protein
MGRFTWISTLALCSAALAGCQYPAGYGYTNYNAKYPAANAAAPAQPTVAPVQAPPSTAPTQAMPSATLGAAAAAATPPVPPPAPSDAKPSPAPLPPLTLPVHEEWSSERCPDLAVTFSGHAQTLPTSPAEAASFEEVRQYRGNGYYEVAECFCAKYGNLSDTTKAAADAAMAETAQQFSDQSNMQTRHISFIEGSPLGKYSELESAAQPAGSTVVTLRTYWRGQCSMRLQTLWTPSSAARAGQFLNSLHEVKAAAEKADASAPAAGDAGQQTSDDATQAADAEKSPGDQGKTDQATADQGKQADDKAGAASDQSAAAGGDLAAEVKQRQTEINSGGTNRTASDAPVAVSPGPLSAISSANLSPDAATRLRQLKELNQKGLITKEEYETKRSEIVNGL